MTARLTSRCARVGCKAHAIRAGLCSTHWTELFGGQR